MAFAKTRYPFTRRMVDGAPKDLGVYVLWRGDELLYIGRASGGASTIQSCLAEHMSGSRCACSRAATHYTWEIALQPALRERQLLQEARKAAGELPPCNRHSA